MVSGDNVSITLTGGPPWGFRLTGGGSLPLLIAKIRKKSQAHTQGLKEGDAVVSINGTPVHDRTHDEAVDLIDTAGDTLTLQIYRGDADDLGQLLASNKPHLHLLPPQVDGEGAVTSSSVQDDGRTRREIKQSILVTENANRKSTTFVRKEHTTTTTIGDVNGNDVTGGRNVTSVKEVSTSVFLPTLSIARPLSPGSPQPAVSPKPAYSPQPAVSPKPAYSPQPAVSPKPAYSPQPAVSPKPAYFPQPAVSPKPAYSPQPAVSPKPAYSPQPAISPKPAYSPQPAISPKPAYSPQPAVSPKPAYSPQPAVSPKPAYSPQPAVSPKPAYSPQPAVSPKPAYSPQPAYFPQPSFSILSAVSPQPVFSPQPKVSTPTWAPRPTFKAVPPKVAPPVAPKPGASAVLTTKPQLAASAGLSTKAQLAASAGLSTKAQLAASAGLSTKAQLAASAGLSTKPQLAAKPTFNAKAVIPGSLPSYSPSMFQVSASAMYSPQASTPAVHKPYSPSQLSSQNQQLSYSPYKRQSPSASNKPYSPGGQPYSPGGQHVLSPMSPMSQPFSPLSPSNATVFNVRNNLGDGGKVWQPNMWLPGHEPQQQQYYPRGNAENIEVPKMLSVKERQQMLLNQANQSARQLHPDFQAPPEEVHRMMGDRKLHAFGPPVEMTLEGPHDDPLGLVRTDSLESGRSSPSSTHRKKKIYSDSAFYEDPSKNYPTIEEQMKLCRLISHSLTSAANRRARGAKMFAKRKRKSSKWVHEGQSEWSSSAGDVANLEELESELHPDEGGLKQLFAFRIPGLKQRITSPEKNTKMTMKKDEFERLRLQGQKCEHQNVPPGLCFDIVADLKASKGRGGRLFERRKHRADKFIIDANNARQPQPLTTFDHLSEAERIQKLNQILKYTPPKPAQTPGQMMRPLTPPLLMGPRSDLKGGSTLPLLKGRNFNRYARGWGFALDNRQERASSEGPDSHYIQQVATPSVSLEFPPLQQSGSGRMVLGDYNARPKAWTSVQQQDSFSCPPSMTTSWNSTDMDTYSHGHYLPADLPACDL